MKFQVPQELVEAALPLLLRSEHHELRALGEWSISHDPQSIALLIDALHQGGCPLSVDNLEGAPAKALKLRGITDYKPSTAYSFYQEWKRGLASQP